MYGWKPPPPQEFGTPIDVKVAVFRPVDLENIPFDRLLDKLKYHVWLAYMQGARYFLGSEYYFTNAKNAISLEEKKKIVFELLSLSNRFPDMLIIAGTILWKENQRLVNAAQVLYNSSVTGYRKWDMTEHDAILRENFYRSKFVAWPGPIAHLDLLV
ncbi:hypothetical protein LXA47_28460, partial [Massilia sp. P8910]|uniref:hypothetical protein n=1 Tax=Massilia antarctica TaxID=2765360 RepID=UPI001E4423A7